MYVCVYVRVCVYACECVCVSALNSKPPLISLSVSQRELGFFPVLVKVSAGGSEGEAGEVGGLCGSEEPTLDGL